MTETEIQSRNENAPEQVRHTDGRADGICPFREGPETLDGLLAEIGTSDPELFDAALDLRSLMAARQNAAATLAQLCRLRALLGDRHYLALYRVRCWVHRHIRADVRPWRGAPWREVNLPRDCARFDAAMNSCLAALAAEFEGWLETARVRFRFATVEELAGGPLVRNVEHEKVSAV